jgi:hypothetical protein
MHLLIPPVAFPRLAETHDPALHRTPLDVLLPLDDHSLGDVDPQDPVPGVHELARPKTASATEVDDEAIVYPVTVQDLQYARHRSEGEPGLADVVDVREVFLVPPRRGRASRGYLIAL